MLENAEHDEEQCPPACCLKHTFCTVKLSVPNHETRSQMIVEVCVDLPTRLQLGSFRAFATSEQVEDAWVLLSAGQSPELAMLTQMLATAQASQPPPNAAARVASKKLCKIPAPKRSKSGRNSGTLSCHVQSLALTVLLAASVPSGLDSVLQSWPRFLVLLPKQPILNPLVNIYIKHGHLGMCYM